MRAVHLRSHAIGHDARPASEAPLTTLLLALIAASGVMLPWAQGLGWSRRGYSYDHGLVAFAAAAGAVAVSGLGALGVINRRLYLRACLGCTLAGLGATLWFYFDVVGSTDPTNWLVSLFRPLRTAGAIGLYVTMAAFVAQSAVLVWHANRGARRRTRMALRSPWTAVALIGVAAAGVLLPWSDSFAPAERGWSFNEGLVALAAAAEAAIVCGLRLSGRIRLRPYALLGLLWAAVGLTAVAWFHAYAIWAIDRGGYPLLVWWLNAPRSGAGLQESVSAAGFIGLMAVLTWQLWQGRRSNI